MQKVCGKKMSGLDHHDSIPIEKTLLGHCLVQGCMVLAATGRLCLPTLGLGFHPSDVTTGSDQERCAYIYVLSTRVKKLHHCQVVLIEEKLDGSTRYLFPHLPCMNNSSLDGLTENGKDSATP
jgi:hypothetical protein